VALPPLSSEQHRARHEKSTHRDVSRTQQAAQRAREVFDEVVGRFESTENRMRPSAIPARERSSGVIPECEVVAGRVIRLSTPPSWAPKSAT